MGLKFRHLLIFFTLQVALFRVVWVVGIGDFFSCRIRQNGHYEFFQKTDDALDKIFYIAAITIRRCSIATGKLLTNYSCETFGGSEPCVSLVGGITQLTAALMRWDKLSTSIFLASRFFLRAVQGVRTEPIFA